MPRQPGVSRSRQGWKNRAHLDLQVEVGGEVHLGLEHGPILAHEVAIDCGHIVARLLILHSSLHNASALELIQYWPNLWLHDVGRHASISYAKKTCHRLFMYCAALAEVSHSAVRLYMSWHQSASAVSSGRLCRALSAWYGIGGLTEFKFISQPRRMPSLSSGKPRSSSSAWLSSSCDAHKSECMTGQD